MFGNEALEDVQGARGLGWASLGIGLAEVAAPRQVENLLGIDDSKEQRNILRVLGVRELMHGFSILTEDRPTHALKTGVWSRVAGDMLDTALLGVAAMKTKKRGRFALVAASVLAIGALDMYYAQRLSRHRDRRWRVV
ncbi:MAG TPA: hypothetical protein VF669_14780 [Tepidisphaeraceae bacterium]|jgi:hypothetical protein